MSLPPSGLDLDLAVSQGCADQPSLLDGLYDLVVTYVGAGSGYAHLASQEVEGELAFTTDMRANLAAEYSDLLGAVHALDGKEPEV